MNTISSLEVKGVLPSSAYLIEQLEGWVVYGLLIFWRTAPSADPVVCQLLSDRAQVLHPHKQLGHPLSDAAFAEDEGDQLWFSARYECLVSLGVINPSVVSDPQCASALIQETPSIPLVQFVQDYRLNETWVFIFALLGFIETSHLLNLAVAELQAPDKSPRITLHLLCSMINSLLAGGYFSEGFSETRHHQSQITPLDIEEHCLVLQHILKLSGDVPLPLQRVQLHPTFWSLLIGRNPLWPGCKHLHIQQEWPVSAKQQADIAHIAPLLIQSFSSGTGLHQNNSGPFQGVIVRGNPATGRENFCCYLALAMQCQPIEVSVTLWNDELLFALACRYAHWLPVLRLAESTQELIGAITTNTTVSTPIAVIWSLDGCLPFKGMIDVTVDLPMEAERSTLWNGFLQNEILSQQLAAQALLSARSIAWIATNACQLAGRQDSAVGLAHIAEARKQLGADKLRALAQPVFRQVTAEALVMPGLVEQALDFIVLRALKREALWQGLGETLMATPNPGVRALFVGESGTGKTLAASYIATRLAAPLYRVDLSAVMNKYIGESEKNLGQLLDYAAAGDVVLLFDEADALFGGRSEGKETGERFANMLTNFLLTRIETHPGIVILTTNSRERIDNAFTRRLDTIVEFPLPAYEERLHLWRSHLGDRGPGEEVYRNLASYCDLAGGQLRNVVLTALVHADTQYVSAENLLEGLRAEYRKLGREMPKKLEGLHYD